MSASSVRTWYQSLAYFTWKSNFITIIPLKGLENTNDSCFRAFVQKCEGDEGKRSQSRYGAESERHGVAGNRTHDSTTSTLER